MDKDTKQKFINDKARQNSLSRDGKFILWSRHAVSELVNEGWDRRLVEQALENCVVIEDYALQHRPLPDCLALSWLANAVPVHVVVAIDETGDRLFVVTVYCPSSQEWENDWTTRK